MLRFVYTLSWLLIAFAFLTGIIGFLDHEFMFTAVMTQLALGVLHTITSVGIQFGPLRKQKGMQEHSLILLAYAILWILYALGLDFPDGMSFVVLFVIPMPVAIWFTCNLGRATNEKVEAASSDAAPGDLK